MIEALLFDAEGVVIDTEPLWDRAQAEFLRRRGLVYERATLKPKLTGRSLLDGTEVMMAECGLTGDVASLAAERQALVGQQIQAGVAWIGGFLDFFQRIRATYRTAIATAMPEDLLRSVDAQLGLAALFSGHVYTARDVAFRSKPAPDIFLFAADRLGVAPAGCVVIEDAPHGITAARRAGMKCIGLATTYDRAQLAEADQVVEAFAQIDLQALDTPTEPG